MKIGPSEMKRGEIWIVDLDPGYGREISKKRPALIISADDFNKLLHTVIIIPFSSQIPSIPAPEMIDVFPDKINKLGKKSLLLPVFIRIVDKGRLVKKVGSISAEKLAEVEYALKIVLGLEPIV